MKRNYQIEKTFLFADFATIQGEWLHCSCVSIVTWRETEFPASQTVRVGYWRYVLSEIASNGRAQEPKSRFSNAIKQPARSFLLFQHSDSQHSSKVSMKHHLKRDPIVLVRKTKRLIRYLGKMAGPKGGWVLSKQEHRTQQRRRRMEWYRLKILCKAHPSQHL